MVKRLLGNLVMMKLAIPNMEHLTLGKGDLIFEGGD